MVRHFHVRHFQSTPSDHVDSVSPLRQPGVSTTASLGPFGTDTEGCTVRDLLYLESSEDLSISNEVVPAYPKKCTLAAFATKHYHRLRGSASTVLTATSQVNGRWRTLTPHRIETREPTATKFRTIDYVRGGTP